MDQEAHRASSPLPAESAPRAAARVGGRATLRVVMLGVNAGMILLIWPLWVTPEARGPGALASIAAATAVLAAGALALAWSARRVAAYLLLGAFPAMLVAGVTLRPEALNAQAFDATAIALAIGSLLAFGASAAIACADVPETLLTRVLPLSAPTPPPARAPWLRAAVITIATSGAAAIAILAPTQGGLVALERDWEAAALEGGLLSAVVGAAVAVAIVAVFLPSALRRGTVPVDAISDRAARVALFLLAALLGTASWYVLRP